MSKKVDLFKALKAMNNQDFDFFLNLSEEEVKDLSPYVLMLWVKGAQENQEIHTILTNSFVNPFVFSLGTQHTTLIYLLLCVANGGYDQTKYQFKKPNATQKSKYVQPLLDAGYGLHEAQDLVNLIPETELETLIQR